MSLQTSLLTDFAPVAAPFVVAPTLDGDALTIVIAGELDVATGHLLEEVQRFAQGTYRTLRYELSALDFIDSSGLRSLLAPVDDSIALSQISIAQPTRAVSRLLELRGLQWLIAD